MQNDTLPMIVSPRERDWMAARYRDGWDVERIATQVRRPVKTVRAKLIAAGIELPQTERSPGPVAARVDLPALLCCYRGGGTVRGCADQHRISYGTARRLLAENLTLRSRGRVACTRRST